MWRQSRGYRARLVLCLVLGLLNIALGLSFIYVSKGLVDIATGRQEGGFWTQVWILAAMLVLRLAVYSVRYWISGRTTQQLTNAMRSRIFLSVMLQPWHGREDKASGDIMSRMTEDLRVVVDCITGDLPALVLALVQLLAASWFLFEMQPGLLWTLLCIMPVAVALSKLYYKVMRQLTRQVRSDEADIQSHVQESIQNRALLLSLGRVPLMDERLTDKHAQLFGTYTRRLAFSIKTHVFVQSGFSIGYYTAFAWGAYGLMQGTVTYGMMTAFLQLVAQVQHPVLNLSSLLPSIVKATTASERIREVCGHNEAQPMPSDDAASQTSDGAMGSQPSGGVADGQLAALRGVRLEHLTYRYPDGEREIIHDFNYEFTPGSHTAIIGPTGSGKSTLVRLLLGF